MIGCVVSCPISEADWVEGRVISFDEDSGRIIVKDECGDTFAGYEYQCEVISEPDEEPDND
jgi:hypothetical protein